MTSLTQSASSSSSVRLHSMPFGANLATWLIQSCYLTCLYFKSGTDITESTPKYHRDDTTSRRTDSLLILDRIHEFHLCGLRDKSLLPAFRVSKGPSTFISRNITTDQQLFDEIEKGFFNPLENISHCTNGGYPPHVRALIPTHICKTTFDVKSHILADLRGAMTQSATTPHWQHLSPFLLDDTMQIWSTSAQHLHRCYKQTMNSSYISSCRQHERHC